MPTENNLIRVVIGSSVPGIGVDLRGGQNIGLPLFIWTLLPSSRGDIEQSLEE